MDLDFAPFTHLASIHPDIRFSPAARSQRALDEAQTQPTACVRLGGARFAALTERASVNEIVDAASASRGHWTITANVDHLRRYRLDPIAQQLIDAADLVVADGMPLIWASRLAGTLLPERVSGSNMIWSICEQARLREQSIFLLGGDPGVAERAASELLAHYPGLEVAGTLCPPPGFEHDEAKLDCLSRDVVAAAPRIVFVALGFPKQDLLIARLRDALPGASFIGVGIGLSFVAGDVARAPMWMRTLGFEWLHRLLQEPRRLARRYLVSGVPFVSRLLIAALLYRVGSIATLCDWGWEARDSAPDTERIGRSDQPPPVAGRRQAPAIDGDVHQSGATGVAALRQPVGGGQAPRADRRTHSTTSA
jgi:N-acetylglucosaminyldiphosphoundecaprenol N-acetyl-beta-D-mannosaminyltransferase